MAFRLIVWTQYVEDGKGKGGDEVSLGSWSAKEAARLAQEDAFQAMVDKFDGHLADEAMVNAYAYEYVIGWDLVDGQTELERFFEDDPMPHATSTFDLSTIE